MKKYLLSAGALLLAVGLALSWAGQRMGGETMATVRLFGRAWNVYAPSAEWGAGWSVRSAEYAEAVPTASLGQSVDRADNMTFTEQDGSPFSAIDLDVDLGNVTIAAGEDYGVEINCWGAGYEVHHWYNGGTLTIESADNGAFTTANCGSEIKVFVPTDVWLESLYVNLDLGDLTLAGLQVEYADIDLDLGSLTGEAMTVTSAFQVDADLGDVNLFGDLGEYVDISADLGGVQLALSRPVTDYCWELEADLGSITVDGKVQRANGESTASGGHGDRMIEVDASLGSITVDFGQDFGGDRPPMEKAGETAIVEEKQGTVPVTEGTGDSAASARDSVWVESE